MRIAIDASRATVARRTGTELYARRMIERLVHGCPDHHWLLYFRDDPGDWLAGLSHVERRVLHAPRLWSYLALAPALLADRPDAFWEPAHVLPPTAPLAGIPSLVTVHDLGYERFPGAHPPLQRLYLRLTTRYHARAATRIVADSETTRRDLIALYDADPERIEVVPLGVDHDRFRPVENPAVLEAVRERYAGGARYLLYVGTLQPRKNLPRLVRAFAPVARAHPGLRLVLAGGAGWQSDALQNEIERLALGERVLRPGYVPGDELPALLSAAEALVFPSLFEGFGLPVLEAMACGTPVITSSTSSLVEVAGDAALLVDPTDTPALSAAMARVVSEPTLRARLREAGLARAARFTWEQSAEQVAEHLMSLAPEQASGPTSIPVLGLPVHDLGWEEAMARIVAMVREGVPHQLVTVNPEFLMAARADPDFMGLLRRADLVLADGVGLQLAAALRGRRFRARITGSDLTPRLAAEAARRGWRLYLLGAAPGVAELAAARLRAAHPTLDIVADGSDPAPDGPPELVARIREAAPQLLLVAYGAPTQDSWIDRFGRATGVPVQIGVGGSLDFVAGIVPRAPLALQRLGLEWLWRLARQPWRWRRMLALPRFAGAVVAERLRAVRP